MKVKSEQVRILPIRVVDLLKGASDFWPCHFLFQYPVTTINWNQYPGLFLLMFKKLYSSGFTRDGNQNDPRSRVFLFLCRGFSSRG